MENNIENIEKIVLRCVSASFYSPYDEDMFFAWINKIECITSFTASGVFLELYVSSSKIKDIDFYNLIGLFHRYKLDLTQLRIFINNENKKMFVKEKAYWYKQMFKNAKN